MTEWDPRDALVRRLGEWVRDPRVRAALADTPRDRYVPDALRGEAFEDRALPFAEGQTISQPTIVAMMTDAVAPRSHETALDVGTGSGYQAAVLARLARRVFGIEVRPNLAHLARRALAADPGVPGNVSVVIADAWRGFPGRLRFDAIVVAAAAPEIPPALLEQLAPGGRLVAPIGPPGMQELVLATRAPDGSIRSEPLGACAFVPLVHAAPRVR